MYRFVALALVAPVSALAAPELQIDWLTPTCTNGYMPHVAVGVSNVGDTATPPITYLDVFAGLASAPTVGTTSPVYRNIGIIAPNTTRFFFFDLPDAPVAWTWVDVIVDTDQRVAESNESNNVRSVRVDWSHCEIP